MQITKELPEAMAVMGFAFYIAPMLLPLRLEMPSGKAGDRLTIQASVVVIMVIAQIVYAMLGAFGASRHGLKTNGNVMVNTWLPPKPQVSLQAKTCLSHFCGHSLAGFHGHWRHSSIAIFT